MRGGTSFAPRRSQAPTHRADAPLVLFALRPRIYSDAIGRVVADLRPGLEVLVVEPDKLLAEMGRRTPALVLCNRLRPEGCDDAVRRSEYRPYLDPEVIRVDGHEESPALASLRGLSGVGGPPLRPLGAALPSRRSARRRARGGRPATTRSAPTCRAELLGAPFYEVE